jgi:hypothetical protein
VGTVNVPEVEPVYSRVTGALTVMLNALSVYNDPSLARMVKLDVVSEPTLPVVPEITPVEEFKDILAGKDPETTEYETAVSSVAETVKLAPVLLRS